MSISRKALYLAQGGADKVFKLCLSSQRVLTCSVRSREETHMPSTDMGIVEDIEDRPDWPKKAFCWRLGESVMSLPHGSETHLNIQSLSGSGPTYLLTNHIPHHLPLLSACFQLLMPPEIYLALLGLCAFAFALPSTCHSLTIPCLFEKYCFIP